MEPCCAEAAAHVIQTVMGGSDKNSIGVLSLAEVADSLLMWAHYAKNHSGFAIGFNTSDRFFVSAIARGAILRRVRYRKRRPKRPLAIERYIHGPVTFLGPMHERVNLNEDWLFTNGTEWAYEKEWRFVRWLKGADQVNNADPLPVHLYKVPPTAISSVILGCRAWNELFPVVSSILENDRHLDHVELIECDEDDGRFQIQMSRFRSNGTAYGPWARALDADNKK